MIQFITKKFIRNLTVNEKRVIMALMIMDNNHLDVQYVADATGSDITSVEAVLDDLININAIMVGEKESGANVGFRKIKAGLFAYEVDNDEVKIYKDVEFRINEGLAKLVTLRKAGFAEIEEEVYNRIHELTQKSSKQGVK